MKILLINGYSTKNRGDFGIVLTTIKRLQYKYPKCRIYIEKNYDDMVQYEKHDVELVNPLIPNNYQGIVKYIMLILSIFKRVQKYNLVVSVGGGYLYSSKLGPFGFGLMRVALSIFLYSKFNKTVIYPQTAGPLRDIDSFILSKLLSKIHMFYARDIETYNWCNMNRIPSTLTNDTVFLKAKKKNIDCKKDLRSVGVTVIDHSFTDKSNVIKKDREMYLKVLAKYINKNFERCNIYIQVDRSDIDTDKFVSEELAKMIQIKYELINVSDCEIEQIIELYSQNDIFLASRMHSAIFSLCSGIETIGIAYQPKTIGMFKLLGIPEYSIDLKSINETYFQDIHLSNRGCEKELNINVWEVI